MAETERRNTRQRRAVEDVLRHTDDFISAQDLHATLRGAGDSIGLATVYRTLSTLAEDERVDVLRTQEGEARYRLCSTDDHHHHLVCRDCGHTVEIEGPAVEEWAERTASTHGFTAVSHTLEVFGRCASCTAAGVAAVTGATADVVADAVPSAEPRAGEPAAARGRDAEARHAGR
ncbi:Fur family transcriptional regulator [Agilicoccus flavus]|uniref:Fur family transcriptional regulator n=1 Tax=Agilicoccus flavus TaxID=2775968 RepID=UPI0027DA80AB|nr:transcriptional repressor [Agilicoccus flavus]